MSLTSPNIYGVSSDTRSFIAECNMTTQDQRKACMIAVARAIAYKQAMPTSAVDNPTEYYLANVYTGAKALIGGVNELICFDIAELEEMVRAFWMMRYHVLYPQPKVYCNEECPLALVSSFMGYGNFTNKAVFDVVTDNKSNIIRYTNGFGTLIDELVGDAQEENADEQSE